MRIIICDDDSKVIEVYKQRINEYSDKAMVSVDIREFTSGEALIFNMEDQLDQVDLIVLDINLGQSMDGIETATKLRKMGYRNQILFLTVDRSRAIEGYDVEAYHYLIKGETSKEKFDHVLANLIRLNERRQEEWITFTCGGESRNIPIGQIKYFEVLQRIIVVYYGEDSFSFYTTMGKLENLMTQRGFVRIHRGYLVAENQIKAMKSNQIILNDEKELPVGRTYAKTVQDKILSKSIERKVVQ